MGNSIKRKVNALTSARLLPNSYLSNYVTCPVCKKVFTAEDTHYLVRLHVSLCYNCSQKKKPQRKPEKSRKNTEKMGRLIKARFDKVRISWEKGCDEIFIDRDNILENSLLQIEYSEDVVNFYKEWKVMFIGELSSDAGGMLREWMSSLIKLLESEELGLFKRCDTNEICYTIDPSSISISDWIGKLSLMGKIMGKALFERIPLNLCFAFTLYKIILEEPITYHDIRFLDLNIYKSILYLIENKIEKAGIEETFSISQYTDGALTTEDLKENGSQIPVTDTNKYEYVNLRAYWMAYKSILPQIEAMKTGFYSVIGKKTVSDLTACELEELLNGKPAISISDWMNNTMYKEPYHKNHEVIKWFWKAVSTYDQTQLGHLVQFATGTSRIPAGGFAVLESNRGEYAKFTIQAMEAEWEGTGQYPLAHTCFNRITLPMYPTYEVLKEKLDYVVNNEILGFGID